MNARDRIKAIQIQLRDAGFYFGEIDGIPGRGTRAGFDSLCANARSESVATPAATVTIIKKPGWNFTVRVDGDDLVVERTTATWFGGDNDPLDNGKTASGVLTRGHPDLLGCALPVLPNVRSTKDSPLPRLPWKIPVEVTRNGMTIETPLIDNGPARYACDGIDLTVAAFKALGGTLKQGVLKNVSYRVRGGARYAA